MIYIICIILLFEYALERYLDYLNKKNYSSELPDELKGIYDDERYRKSQEYERANDTFSFYTSTFSLVLMLLLLFSGSFALLQRLAPNDQCD